MQLDAFSAAIQSLHAAGLEVRSAHETIGGSMSLARRANVLDSDGALLAIVHALASEPDAVFLEARVPPQAVLAVLTGAFPTVTCPGCRFSELPATKNMHTLTCCRLTARMPVTRDGFCAWGEPRDGEDGA